MTLEGKGPRQEWAWTVRRHCDGEDRGVEEELERAGPEWPRVELHTYSNVLRSHLSALCGFLRMA